MAKNDPPYLGVDLGGTNIEAGILDGKDKLLVSDAIKTKADGGAETVIKRVGKLVDSLLEKASLKRSDVGGLGIGAPGAINVKKGVVLNAVNLRWNHFPLSDALRDELKMPVTVDNDVNVGTWGEYCLGAGKGTDDMLGVFVGTGIGGGIVLGGELYHGHFYTAGEIGHTVMRADAPLGRRTLENLASRTAVVNLLTNLIRANHPSIIPELVDGDLGKIRSKILAQAVEKKDPLTLEVITASARYVGAAAANVVTLLSLPCVVIGGGFASALGAFYLELVKEAFDQHVFPHELRKIKVKLTELHDEAGVIGAALLARRRLSENT